MLGQGTFDASVDWTLKFKDNALEAAYRGERLSLNHIPPQVRCACILLIALVFTMVCLDVMGACAFRTSYAYDFYDILSMTMYIPIFISELVLYKCQRISFLRGSVFTIVVNLFMFSSTVITYSDKLDYPAISPTYFEHY